MSQEVCFALIYHDALFDCTWGGICSLYFMDVEYHSYTIIVLMLSPSFDKHRLYPMCVPLKMQHLWYSNKRNSNIYSDFIYDFITLTRCVILDKHNFLCIFMIPQYRFMVGPWTITEDSHWLHIVSGLKEQWDATLTLVRRFSLGSQHQGYDFVYVSTVALWRKTENPNIPCWQCQLAE